MPKISTSCSQGDKRERKLGTGHGFWVNFLVIVLSFQFFWSFMVFQWLAYVLGIQARLCSGYPSSPVFYLFSNPEVGSCRLSGYSHEPPVGPQGPGVRGCCNIRFLQLDLVTCCSTFRVQAQPKGPPLRYPFDSSKSNRFCLDLQGHSQPFLVCPMLIFKSLP